MLRGEFLQAGLPPSPRACREPPGEEPNLERLPLPLAHSITASQVMADKQQVTRPGPGMVTAETPATRAEAKK